MKPVKKLQNNYFSAVIKLKSLQKRIKNDPGLNLKYNKTIQTDLDKKLVKPVEMQAPPPESIWYLPRRPVTNPNKPGKLRRAANAASKFRGESLNSNLLTGPDLLNNLVGILFVDSENIRSLSFQISKGCLCKLTSDKKTTLVSVFFE